MIIGIDGNEANVKNRVGIGEYAYQTLAHLYKIKESKVVYHIYLKEKPRDDLPKETDRWIYKVVGPKRLWTQFGLPLHLLFEKDRSHVFFTPSHYIPRFTSVKRVFSIMDLSFVDFPQMFRKKDLWQLSVWTRYSVEHAEKILTISRFSKEAIIRHYNLSEDKVVVTYPGYKVLDPLRSGPISSRFESLSDFILFVGTLQPRKNISRLLLAFSFLVKEFPSLQLVIAGKKGWLYEKFFETVKKLSLEKKVIFTGFISDSDLLYLYKKAKCFILPSLYEGFGLPVLEAMTYGCPVVASKASSLPEVVGEAGVLVDPLDPHSIAEGVLKVLRFDVDKRREMIEKGKLRAQKFSWEKCARETLKVLLEVRI